MHCIIAKTESRTADITPIV